MKKISLFLVIMAFVATGASAAIKYVKPGTGSTVWTGKSDFYTTIAAAITAAAEGDEIWVAQGTYGVTAALTWKNGVDVYGGFAGHETDRGQRSKDPLLTIVQRSGGNTRLLAATAALTTPTTWSGFTFQNSTGGGVQMHANCILDNCVVWNNARSGTGGGILADAGGTGDANKIVADIVVQNCRIINNQASSTNAGGAIYARASGSSTGKFILRNSVIANNRGGNNGGGIAVYAVPSEITYCTFAKNKREEGGWPGGATYMNNAQTTIANCIFWGNDDTYKTPHPDIYIQPGLAGCSVKNCIVSRELTHGNGSNGDEYDIIDAGSNVTLENITVLTAPATNDELKFASPSSTAGYAANANLNADWSIQSGSVAIDAGATIAGLTTDIIGRARPKFTGVDVGAYEYADAIDIAATGNSAIDYDATTMGDVIIRANDSEGTGQWSATATTVTDGVVKVVKAVEANKVYAIGFPFAVSSVNKPFATLLSYNGAINELEDASGIEAGKGYLVSFAAAGDVIFTSAPNPTLLTTYPEAADYKLVPALSLKNEASISGATKYYSYDISTAKWSGAEDAVAGGALKPFDAVIVSTATGNYYTTIGTGLPGSKSATVAVAGEGHVTVTVPAKGFPTYRMGLAGGSFDLKFRVDEGYVPESVTTKLGTDPAETPYALGAPDGGEYTVSINPITDSVTITITTAKQQFDVAVTVPSGVSITAPTGNSPYKVYYDSTFVLKFTLDDNAKYFPQVAIDAAAAVIPPVEDGNVYVVTLPRVKASQTIAVSLAERKTVTLTAGAGISITKPAGGAGAYEAPQGSSFTYAFAVEYGYNAKVNGEQKAAGEYTFALNNDTTLNITATAKKWTVTLDTTGSNAGIALTEAYPTGGYEVEHKQPKAISFSVAAGKYPAVTLTKGAAYVLTKSGDVYTLTLPVTDDLNVGLRVQEAVALPRSVVPVAEDVSSRGVGTATDAGTIFVINKGANNGNSYATHLKFDFSHLPLSTLAQFSSAQLKLTAGWQANDAAGAQWEVTETADGWSEKVPFLMSASPAPVDTIGTFRFGDIHPATPTADVGIYLDLTDYLTDWLKAPERTTDKILSLRIYNKLQTSNGGEVDLKSKENTTDIGPKLIFGSVNTALSSLTVDGKNVLEANRYVYSYEVESEKAGSKMPPITYELAEPSSYVSASAVTYTPTDSTIAAGQQNGATFTVAPIAALEGEGVKRTYSVKFILPMEIGAAETKASSAYTEGSIIFHVTDTSAGQLTVSSSTLTVSGVVKVVRTVEANRFYAVGFPFDATPSVPPLELYIYDGRQLQPATNIEKGKGYLIKFAAAGEVTFTSTPNPVLPQSSTIISVSNSDYSFIANPYVSNVLSVPNMAGAYYRYNSTGHYFEKVLTPNPNPNPVKPFDAIIVSTNRAAQYISLGTDSKLPHSVTCTKSNGINVTSGQAATVVVPHDSAYVLTFTVDDCYENPAVAIANNSGYTLGAPNASGVYTVRIDAVTVDTAISISATRKTFGVTVTKGSNVTFTQGGNDSTLNCGEPYTAKFTVASGTTPAVTVNGKPYPLAAPVSDEYAITLTITAETTIDIQTGATRQVTVSMDSCVSLISTTGQPTTTAGVYGAADGNPFEVNFRLNTGYNSPQVTNATLTGPDNGGVYAATIGSVTRDTAVSITALLNSYTVTVNTNGVAQVTTPDAPYEVKHGKTFALEFSLNEGYENPQVKVGGTGYALGAPAGGVYAVTTGAVTSDTAISITASLKRCSVTVTSDGNVTPSIAVGVPHDTTYGSAFTFTFTLNEHYTSPQVTIGGVGYTLGAPAGGVYAVAIDAVTRDTSVSITASLEAFEVTVAAEHVTITSPASAGHDTVVTYGEAFAVTFTVDERYENPQVTVNGVSYTLGSPDAQGVYTVTDTVTQATAVSIVASPVEYELTLTAGANITLVSPTAAGSVSAAYGSAFVVKFEVAAGYRPVLKTDGVEVAIEAPDAQGVYTVTATPQVTGEHLVAITAVKDDAPSAVYREDLNDPVVRVQYYTLAGVEVTQPAATGVYIVKRTLASKKVAVRKELVVVW